MPTLRRAKAGGWNGEQHSYIEQYYFTDGKLRPKNKLKPRGTRNFADYLLLYDGELQDNVDTYEYFDNPIYSYSLKQGIDDGFLALYRVYRIATRSDKDGWSITRKDVMELCRLSPDQAGHLLHRLTTESKLTYYMGRTRELTTRFPGVFIYAYLTP